MPSFHDLSPWPPSGIITLIDTIPVGALRFTPTSLHLYTVLSRNLCSPWNGDVVFAQVIIAPANLTGPPSVHICKQSPNILAVEPALAGEQPVIVDVRTSLAGLVIVSRD